MIQCQARLLRGPDSCPTNSTWCREWGRARSGSWPRPGGSSSAHWGPPASALLGRLCPPPNPVVSSASCTGRSQENTSPTSGVGHLSCHDTRSPPNSLPLPIPHPSPGTSFLSLLSLQSQATNILSFSSVWCGFVTLPSAPNSDLKKSNSGIISLASLDRDVPGHTM